MNEQIKVKDVSPVKVQAATGQGQKTDHRRQSRIYVRSVQGVIENFRRLFGFIFLGIFAIIPWLQYEGHQAILFDIAAQRFSIFGLTLWPQDLTVLAYILIVSAFALFFVTTFAGRVWCGFMCPQTTWTYIYIWFEEKIEGSRNKRILLDKRDMDADKFLRKSTKHLAWIIVALLTALTFVGYFTPIDRLFIDFFTFQSSFWLSFWVLFFTACTYGNAGFMREIMCTHICPYARFQSAMFDKDTFTVAYNPARGESRGPRARKTSQAELKSKGLGDCIDCNLCVQVCPTGIDIRNGLQYECINCGACVDACNGVMDKMGYERGLISFTTEHQLAGGTSKILRPKLIAYATILSLMCGLLIWDIATRVPFALDIIRDRNMLDRENIEGLIENVYTLKILNKSQQSAVYQITVSGIKDTKLYGKTEVTVAAGKSFDLPISVGAKIDNIDVGTQKIYFHLATLDDKGNTIEIEEPTTFIFTGV